MKNKQEYETKIENEAKNETSCCKKSILRKIEKKYIKQV